MDTNIIVIMCAWFAGGFISGASGIGGAMFAVPIAALFLPIQDVIVLSCILNMAMDGSIALMHFRFCRVSALLPMLAGAVPGSVAGLFVLLLLPGNVLQASVGILLVFFVCWQHFFRVRRASGNSWKAGGAAGFLAGLLGTSISFDGPPVGAYGLYAGWKPREFLGTLGVFFIIRGAITCSLQAYSGYYTPEILHYALYGFPPTVLGALCAFPLVKWINVEAFRRILKFIIVAAALVCLLHAFL